MPTKVLSARYHDWIKVFSPKSPKEYAEERNAPAEDLRQVAVVETRESGRSHFLKEVIGGQNKTALALWVSA
ncbi:MAG: hypothetical protein ACI97A_001208 [Planctomycetota bacterium]